MREKDKSVTTRRAALLWPEVVRAWQQAGGVPNASKLARTLGIGRRTLYNYMDIWKADGKWPPSEVDIGLELGPPMTAEELERGLMPGSKEGPTPRIDPSIAATREFLARMRDDATISPDTRTKAALGLLRAAPEAMTGGGIDLDGDEWEGILVDALQALGERSKMVLEMATKRTEKAVGALKTVGAGSDTNQG